MTRMLGMVFGCMIAAGLLVLGLRFAPSVEVPTDGEGQGVAAVVVPEPAVVEPQVDDTGGPEVDVLRVERDGAMLVSGRATPGAEVEIVVDEQMAGTASVDMQGNFVAFLDLPESDASQSLNLRERDGEEARLGKQSFVIEPPRPAPAGPAPEPSAPPAADLDVRTAAGTDASTPVATNQADPPRPGSMASAPADYDSPPVTPAITPLGSPAPVAPRQDTFGARLTTPSVAEPPLQPEAPRVLQVENGSLSVVQDGAPRPGLSIDTIRYSANGTVVLGGRAPEAASVRVYLDNRPLDAVPSEADGQWRLDMPALAERTYTLRVDQLNAEGEVTARAETPFRPESAASLDALQGMVEDGVRRVTVQPGFTLWAIAESNYGDGLSFVRVFEANADKIGDPDLIYPGQIFAVPD